MPRWRTLKEEKGLRGGTDVILSLGLVGTTNVYKRTAYPTSVVKIGSQFTKQRTVSLCQQANLLAYCRNTFTHTHTRLLIGH